MTNLGLDKTILMRTGTRMRALFLLFTLSILTVGLVLPHSDIIDTDTISLIEKGEKDGETEKQDEKERVSEDFMSEYMVPSYQLNQTGHAIQPGHNLNRLPPFIAILTPPPKYKPPYA